MNRQWSIRCACEFVAGFGFRVSGYFNAEYAKIFPLVFKNDRKGVSLSNRQTDILAERSALANEIYGIKI